MKSPIAILAVVLLFGGWSQCRADFKYPTIANFKHNDSVQDPETKTTYYIESDRRHVVAISRDGKVVWCTEVIPEKFAGKMLVVKVELGPITDRVGVEIWRVGWGGGWINKETGAYTDGGRTL